MDAALPLIRPAEARAPTAVGVAVTNLAVWTGVTVLHSVATFGDQLRRGALVSLPGTLGWTALAYLPWLAFSLTLCLLLRREPTRVTDPRAMRRLVAWSVPLFLLPEVAYQVLLSVMTRPDPMAAFLPALRRWSPIFWLIDIALLAATFAVVYAAFALLERVATERRRERAEADLAHARAELGQQRLRVLRAQLEPHFLFNTLSAISGLVRGDDRRLAIKALGDLSALLRYALSATQRDWVTLDDEVALVDQYLALQQLRYGPRLRVDRSIDPEALGADCPPLLLQPLVENAIRHDLERHGSASTIRIVIGLEGESAWVEVANGLRASAPPNPGLGLGLRATRDRLALLYGERARLVTSVTDAEFSVRVTFPRIAHD